MSSIFRLPAVFILLTGIYSCGSDKDVLTSEDKAFISNQYKNIISVCKDPAQFPRTVASDGNLVNTNKYEWTSGFFAGNLWYLYELTGNNRWKTEAVKWTEALDSIQYWTGSHDVGFMINCSYGNGLRLTGSKNYEKVIIQTAESLCKRYNPVTKCIKSWDYRKAWNDTTEWFYPVIIDNMMNLELLFEASKLSGNKKYEQIALQHALTTMKNHYRSDYSSYHVVDYDTLTGSVLDKATCQGYADESSWARGQAWGLYGYIVCYRYTHNPLYLDFAEHIASYILKNPNLPEDMVPYWDYNVGDKHYKPEWKYDSAKYPVIPRDASAAAVTASALLELSSFSKVQPDQYKSAARKILNSLKSPSYMSSTGNKYFILNHSVGSIPHHVEIDVPLVYADYYFLEALLREKKMK